MKTGEIPCESRMGNFQDKMWEREAGVLIAVGKYDIQELQGHLLVHFKDQD